MTALITPDAARELATPGRLDALITAIRGDLAEAVTLAEHNEVAARAAAVLDLARRAKVAEGIRYDAAKLAVQAQYALAHAYATAPKNTGTRGRVQPGMRGTGEHPECPPVVDERPTRDTIGITRSQARGLLALKEVPRTKAEAFFARCDEERRPSAMSVRRLVAYARAQRAEHACEFHPMIKSSDNWNFDPQSLRWGRRASGTEEDLWGYIVGEVYANALFQNTHPGGLIVAPMAGSGLVYDVYRDRDEWMRPEPWDLDLRMFDLTPRGDLAPLIGRHDLTEGFPDVGGAPDYVVMDVPYFGISRGQYGDDPGNLANLERWDDYEEAMGRIARHCAAVQRRDARLTFVSPNYSDVKAGDYIPAAHMLTRTFEDAGYRLYSMAYSSRRIQQIQGHHMAVLNNWARRHRVMLTDISEIVTLRRG